MPLTDELLAVHQGLTDAMEATSRAMADPAADRNAIIQLASHLSAAHAVLHDIGRRARAGGVGGETTTPGVVRTAGR